MSFVRWGPDSDLYIYTRSPQEDVVCLGCPSMPVHSVYSSFTAEVFDENGDFSTHDLHEMLNHVRDHRERGHKVPLELEENLMERWP